MSAVAQKSSAKEAILATKLYHKKLAPSKRSPPKPFPSNVSIRDIVNSLPQEVFAQDRFKAFCSLFSATLGLVLSIYLLATSPWYLWPVGWVIGGASIAGLFAIGNDCAYHCFAKSNIVNDVVGTLIMLPLGYAFEAWKTCHQYYSSTSVPQPAIVDSLWKWTNTWYTWWLANVCHWVGHHFNVEFFKPEDRLRVRLSIYTVYAFAAVFFPAMFYFVGLQGIVKFWLLPILAFHVLMSTTTMLPRVIFGDSKVSPIVHCVYPGWLEFLTNDSNIRLPRNISTAIPHYNLRSAYKSLKSNWGDYLCELPMDWDLFRDLVGSARGLTPSDYVPFPQKPSVPVDSDVTGPAPQPASGFLGFIRSVISFLGSLNWLHMFILVPTPIIALYGWLYVTPAVGTVVFTIFYYWWSGLGITAGYHRLWAHKAYTARLPLKLFLMFGGTAAVEGSIRWWCRDHRAHHRYTDTDKDPYNANRGFLYSHIGWMLLKQEPGRIGRASIEDLNADPWIRFQHKHYIGLALFTAVIFPTAVCGILFGDWKGGYFYAAIMRLVFVHHATFLVNSLAHYLGDMPFADNHTPKDSILTAFLTFGEGYHNFHHEFPHDYRNAIKFYQYDPTKWLIILAYYVGQATGLKMFPENEVFKGQIQMRQKMLDKMKKKVHWGVPEDELPIIPPESIEQVISEGFKVVIINDLVHDVTEFIADHPGGRAILEPYVGKDATAAFNGGVYSHSNAANNLLTQMRVGRIDKTEGKKHA